MTCLEYDLNERMRACGPGVGSDARKNRTTTLLTRESRADLVSVLIKKAGGGCPCPPPACLWPTRRAARARPAYFAAACASTTVATCSASREMMSSPSELAFALSLFEATAVPAFCSVYSSVNSSFALTEPATCAAV
jgi:hypothetical protein